ncbi:60S ribosomal protein L7 [Taenia crassiceps]|uniref:60S ribosomal protein L7 n=1 Tax=Taenia crassiceps TaxID=6207 RepID=A0ABR4Q2I0_9CEST
MAEPEKMEEAPKTEVAETTPSTAEAKPAPPKRISKRKKSSQARHLAAKAAVSVTTDTEGSAKTGAEGLAADIKGEKSATKKNRVPKMPEKLKYRLTLRVGRRNSELKRKIAQRLKYLRMKKICIEHAQKYLIEYKRAAKREISLMRSAQKAGNFYVPAEPKLAFVATLNMLRLIDPYIAWGYPSLRTVRRLIYKRGFCKVRGQRLPLTNEHIQRKLGRFGIVCVEDLVHEIYTVGPNFKKASAFLWRFKLNNPTGGFRKKGRHFVEGGDFGNRENYINKLLKTMI